ncbi:YciI family protein [Mesorhizobium sp. KR9-304]|uniref:YciI family protein n=1 Tax=Mesorhizobium sp. KR9-304 TaxID=3156614 RepID=UPI0032B3C544
MNYVCLVYGEERHIHALSKEGLAELDRRSVAYDKSIEKAGKLVTAQALQSVKTSRTVRKRKGKVVVTDGPFAETKEQLLGFVMLQAESLEEALELAGGIPIAEFGTIEVRAVYDVPGL